MGEILTFKTSKHYIPYGNMEDYKRLYLNEDSIATLTYNHYELKCIPERDFLNHVVSDLNYPIPFPVELTTNTRYRQTGSFLQFQGLMIHILKEWDNTLSLGYYYQKGSLNSLNVKDLNPTFSNGVASVIEETLINETSDAFPIEVKMGCDEDNNELEILFIWEAPEEKHDKIKELCKQFQPNFKK